MNPACALELFHHTRNELFGVGNAFQDKLDIHRRLTWLPSTLAIDAMLAHQDEGIGQNVQCQGKPATRNAHLRLVILELFPAFLIYGHVFVRCGRTQTRSSKDI